MNHKKTEQLVESIFGNLNIFRENYGSGMGASEKEFGLQFADAAVRISTKELGKNSLDKEAINNLPPEELNVYKEQMLQDIKKISIDFMELTKSLKSSEFTYAIELFKKNVADQFPMFTTEHKNIQVLQNNVREIILEGFNEVLNPDKFTIDNEQQSHSKPKFK